MSLVPVARAVLFCLLFQVSPPADHAAVAGDTGRLATNWQADIGLSFIFDICKDTAVGVLYRRALFERLEQCHYPPSLTDALKISGTLTISALDKRIKRESQRWNGQSPTLFEGTLTCPAVFARADVINLRWRLLASADNATPLFEAVTDAC